MDERLYPELIAETVRGSGAGAESKGGDSVVDRLLELRQSSRKAKDFAKADQIRLLLTEVGVEVEDSPKGTRWTVK